uniref:Pyruvate kinase n=2 Tax=Schistocephalus solidus TaxID=70667 RepID=A0A0X3P3T2_SCHSO
MLPYVQGTLLPINLQSGIFFGGHTSERSDTRRHSRLAHACNLDIDQVADRVRKCSIVCTLGDSWTSPESIQMMKNGGMNILRLNLSMTPPETCRRVISCIRALDELSNFTPCVAVAMDMTAPPIRTGIFEGGIDAEVFLKEGDMIDLTMDKAYLEKSTTKQLFVDTSLFPQMISCVYRGDRIHIGDGLITLVVQTIGMNYLTCLIEEGGTVGGYQRVFLPRERQNQLHVKSDYEKDLSFAAECGVDFVFTSFVTDADMSLARSILSKQTKLFAKLETRDSIKSLPQLIATADGIIISRADLGLQYSPEKIFKLQKYVISHCNVAARPVFVIGQLLESMRTKPRPTRAESTDVANAVLDGADGIILSVETSRGIFPLETLSTVDRVCREAERAFCHETYRAELKQSRLLRGLDQRDATSVTAISAVEASASCGATAIFVITTSGRSAISTATAKPSCPIIVITRDPIVARHCHAYHGLHSYVYTGPQLEDWCEDMDLRINTAISSAKERRLVSAGDTVVIVIGSLAGEGSTNTMQIFHVPDDKATLKVVSSRNNLVYPEFCSDAVEIPEEKTHQRGIDELLLPI